MKELFRHFRLSTGAHTEVQMPPKAKLEAALREFAAVGLDSAVVALAQKIIADPSVVVQAGLTENGQGVLDLRFAAERVASSETRVTMHDGTVATYPNDVWRSRGVRVQLKAGQPVFSVLRSSHLSAAETDEYAEREAEVQNLSNPAVREKNRRQLQAIRAQQAGWKQLEQGRSWQADLVKALTESREGVGYFDNRTGTNVYKLTGNSDEYAVSRTLYSAAEQLANKE